MVTSAQFQPKKKRILRDLPPKPPDFFQAIRISFGTSKAHLGVRGLVGLATTTMVGFTSSSSILLFLHFAIGLPSLTLISFFNFTPGSMEKRQDFEQNARVLGFEVPFCAKSTWLLKWQFLPWHLHFWIPSLRGLINFDCVKTLSHQNNRRILQQILRSSNTSMCIIYDICIYISLINYDYYPKWLLFIPKWLHSITTLYI